MKIILKHLFYQCQSHLNHLQIFFRSNLIGDENFNLPVDDTNQFDYKLKLGAPDLFSPGPEFFSVTLTAKDSINPSLETSITLDSPPMHSTLQYNQGKLSKADWSSRIDNKFGVVYLHIAGQYPVKKDGQGIDKIRLSDILSQIPIQLNIIL